MPVLSFLARLFVIRRLFGGRQAERRYGYGRHPSRYGHGRRRRSGGFGMFGPFPYYSRQTRRGGRVSVSGCCLPLALGVLAVPIGLLRVLLRR